MQQGAQNAPDKLRKRSPKGRRAPSRLPIYTYTRAPHNVNGEIAHCFPPSVSPSCAALDRCGAHALELQVAVVRAGMLRCRGAAPQPFFTASRQIVQAGACSLASGMNALGALCHWLCVYISAVLVGERRGESRANFAALLAPGSHVSPWPARRRGV